MDRRKSIQEQYLGFMGSWLAGAVVGRYLAKIIIFILAVWCIGKFVCN